MLMNLFFFFFFLMESLLLKTVFCFEFGLNELSLLLVESTLSHFEIQPKFLGTSLKLGLRAL